MPRRIWPCGFCSETFASEWEQINHSSRNHSDLNQIISLIQVDRSNVGVLTDLTQYYDPTLMDIILP